LPLAGVKRKMGQSITLAIPIIADSGNYEVALNRVKSEAQEAAQTITALQRKIDSQFQKAGSDFTAELQRSVQMRQAIKESVLSTDPYHAATAGSWLPGNRADNSAEIQQRLTAETELQDRLFRAQHTGLENALRDHSAYFAELKMQYAGSEQMMTVITQTEEAERLKIREQFANQTNSMIARLLHGGMRGFGTAALVIYGLDVGLKALNTGLESAAKGEGGAGITLAVLKSFPLIGTLNADLEKTVNLLSGATAETKAWVDTLKGIRIFDKIQGDMAKTIKLLQSPTTERPAMQIQAEYEARTKEIAIARWKQLKALDETAKAGGYSDSSALDKQRIEDESHDAFAQARVERDAKLVESSKQFAEQLTHEADTYGMAARQIELYDAAKKASPLTGQAHVDAMANLDKATAAAKSLDILDAQKEKTDELAEATKKVDDALSDVELEYIKLHMTGPQAARAELEEGMSPEALEANKKNLKAYEQERRNIENYEKAVSAEKATTDFAKRIRESLLTPIEQFKKFRDELKKTNFTIAEKELALTNKMGELMGRGGERRAANDFIVIEDARYKSLAFLTQTKEDPGIAELRKISANTLKTANNPPEGVPH
jgi:hypothetical protein